MLKLCYNKISFAGKLRRMIFPRESQLVLQAFVLSMLFQKEDCHPSVHLTWLQMQVLKVTAVTQVALTTVHQVTVAAHKQVIPLQA